MTAATAPTHNSVVTARPRVGVLRSGPLTIRSVHALSGRLKRPGDETRWNRVPSAAGVQTPRMEPLEVDMDGRPVDQAMHLASRIVHERTASQPSFAGLWFDLQAREIHLAFAEPTAAAIVEELQMDVPPDIRLRAHEFQHTLAELEALHQAASVYMEREGYRRQFMVDTSVQVESNLVHVNLKHTTPPDVLERVRARFPGAPLQIDLTTARWVTV